MYKTKLIIKESGSDLEKSLEDFLNSSEVKEIITIGYSVINGDVEHPINSKLQTAVKHTTGSPHYTALVVYKL